SWSGIGKNFDLLRKRIKSIEQNWESKLKKKKNYVSLQEISITAKIEQWKKNQDKYKKILFRKDNKKFWIEYFSR
ncbi:MAG: hypothetical protein PF689_09775, partial [Deltaproteobacteria bacterium]|nr:hypothetical protein [Deltaproteobacteria bacterium]